MSPKDMKITRFSVIPDERRVLMGIDKANVFKAGRVYEAIEIFGQIVIKDMGEYALPKEGDYPCEFSRNDEIMECGKHLLTLEEYKTI